MKKLVFLSLFIFSSTAFSYTDCQKEVLAIYVGDSGVVYIRYVGGGGISIPSTHEDQKNALTLALSAFMGGKRIAVRTHADGQSCTDVLTDFRGMYLLNSP